MQVLRNNAARNQHEERDSKFVFLRYNRLISRSLPLPRELPARSGFRQMSLDGEPRLTSLLVHHTSGIKGETMWIEYVREGLKKGQQVFRRSVVEALMAEIEQQKPTSGDSAQVAALKRELAIVKKQYRDLNIRFYQSKSGKDEKGKLETGEPEGDGSILLGERIETLE